MKRPPIDRAHAGRYAWYVIALLTAVNAFSYMDRMALAVLAPHIKADLHLSDAQLGLLTGLAFSLFYAICGIPIARLADRGTRRSIIAIALATWSVMTAVSGAAQNFWHLFAARVGIGAGEAGSLPPAQSLICDYVPLRRRSGVFAIHNFGNYAGMMLGLVMAGWLGETIGWRWTFLALGLPGIALALLVRISVREPTRGVFDTVQEIDARPPFAATLKGLWNCKTFRLITCLYALNGFMQYGLNQWWPSFFVRSHHLSLSSIGMQLGLAIGIGSGIGSLFGGLMAHKAAQHDVRWPLIIGGAATLLALPTALASLFAKSTTTAMLLILVTAMLWSVFNGPTIAAATSVVSSRMRATAGSINIFAASVLGFGLGPFSVGLLSDLLAPAFGTESLRYALLAPACLLPVMSIVLYAAAKALPADLKGTSGMSRAESFSS